MDTKLTLKLNNLIIERAKEYALINKISLSRIIESYLDAITKSESKDFEITPLVESLSGVINLSSDYDYKEDYANYLNEKYK